MADKNRVTVDITTGIGTLSFPHVFRETASQKDDGTPSFDIQIIIPKTQREDARALLRAIQTVGKAKWGENWTKVKNPLRDGDKEADDVTDDGSTKGEKYPERLGSYFLNARSAKPVGVYDRGLVPITEPDTLYGGCKGKISITFYPYSNSGNHGIGAGLNGVQKVGEGTPFGSGKPSVDSMFELLEGEDDSALDGLDEEVEEVEVEAPKPAAKKAAAKKATAKKAAATPPADDDEIDLLDDLDI